MLGKSVDLLEAYPTIIGAPRLKDAEPQLDPVQRLAAIKEKEDKALRDFDELLNAKMDRLMERAEAARNKLVEHFNNCRRGIQGMADRGY